jgi:fimbrial chaperone protein
LAGALAFALATSAMIAPVATAMTVQPLLIDMNAKQGANARSVTVQNTTGSALPVELTFRSMTMSEDGSFVQKPEESPDFLIFPPQAVIQPGQSQTFRLQWLGEPSITTSASYILSVAQMPVELPSGTSGVQIIYNFQLMANVAPSEGRPVLQVEKAEIIKDEAGKVRAAVTVENTTDVHGYFSATRMRLSFRNSSGTVQTRIFEAAEMNNLVGFGLVQPRSKRRFILQLDEPGREFVIPPSTPGAEGVLTAEVLAYVGLQ